jgi:nucleoside-diphosphate-sugar epimerase
MRVFVTGATGFIGSALVPELIHHGHQVLGLARSDAGASALAATGAEVLRGDLQDLETLRRGASGADAVIHTAFVHDFSRFAEVCEIDRVAIETLGSTLAGSDRQLIVTSGLALLTSGRLATENDPPAPLSAQMPRASEHTAASLAGRGINTAVVRLPQVHDTFKQGLVTYAIQVARQKGVSVYVGDGSNAWAAAHVLDVARLYRLAVEKHEAGARYHAIGEEGVPARDIAEAIGRGLNVPVVSMSPEEAADHFGWMSRFMTLDLKGSSLKTQERLGWHPTGPGLISDLNNMDYSAVSLAVS